MPASHFIDSSPANRPPMRSRIENPNPLRSTGPRTEQGKATSSRNSLRHGLTAQQTVIPGEDQAGFDRLHQDLLNDRKPEGELELQLTGEIAACMWRLARARRHEADLLRRTHDIYERGADRLSLILRYLGSIERQLNRTIVRLEQIQAARRKLASSLPAVVQPELKVMAAGAGEQTCSFTATAFAPEFVSSHVSNPPSSPIGDHAQLIS